VFFVPRKELVEIKYLLGWAMHDNIFDVNENEYTKSTNLKFKYTTGNH
jgi:hypothetical protein